MNREFKFRVWDTVAEKYFSLKSRCSIGFEDRISGNVRHPIIIEQAIGLKDRNGVEIYEGDVIKEYVRSYGPPETFVYNIYWCEKCFGFMIGEVRFDNTIDCEVIGNIHEDPFKGWGFKE